MFNKKGGGVMFTKRNFFYLVIGITLSLTGYGCSTVKYGCNTQNGATCMKVEDVIKSPLPTNNSVPVSSIRRNRKGKVIPKLILNEPKEGNVSETPEVKVVHEKPIVITIFSYEDKNGIIHGTNDHVLPPKLPRLELNKEEN
jgi:hypothetical protein